MSPSPRARGPAQALIVAAAVASAAASGGRRLRITNGCDKEPLWVAHMAGAEDGPDPQNARLGPGEHHDFDTHDGLSSTRYWPKMRCNDEGNACLIGESGGPGQDCTNCAPPIDTKFEGTFGTEQGIDWIDVSLVDGWTLPFKFQMTLKGTGKCNAGDGNRSVLTSLDCSTLTLDKCPSHEILNSEQANLQVIHPDEGQVVGCYSPCAKLTASNWDNKLALGVSPADDKAVEYCCPTPPESPHACRTGPVEKTSFVKAVHKNCPGVYGYAYDDGMGLITCPKDTEYEMIFYCPDGPGQTTTVPAPTTTTTVPAEKKHDHSQEPEDHVDKNKKHQDVDKNKASSSGESTEQVAFLLEKEQKYPSHEYCGDSYIFQGAVPSHKNCEDRCSGDDSCAFYSYWTTGDVPWCGLTSSCETRESDSVENVTMYKKVRFSGSSTIHASAPAECCFEDSSVDEPCKAGCRSRTAVTNGYCVPRETWCDTCSEDSVCNAPIFDASVADASKEGKLMIMRKDEFHAFVNMRRGKSTTWRSPVLALVCSTAALTVAAGLALKVRRAVALRGLRQEGPPSASPGTIGSTSPGSTIGSPMPPRSP